MWDAHSAISSKTAASAGQREPPAATRRLPVGASPHCPQKAADPVDLAHEARVPILARKSRRPGRRRASDASWSCSGIGLALAVKGQGMEHGFCSRPAPPLSDVRPKRHRPTWRSCPAKSHAVEVTPPATRAPPDAGHARPRRRRRRLRGAAGRGAAARAGGGDEGAAQPRRRRGRGPGRLPEGVAEPAAVRGALGLHHLDPPDRDEQQPGPPAPRQRAARAPATEDDTATRRAAPRRPAPRRPSARWCAPRSSVVVHGALAELSPCPPARR